jgi:hypothetical protein
VNANFLSSFYVLLVERLKIKEKISIGPQFFRQVPGTGAPDWYRKSQRVFKQAGPGIRRSVLPDISHSRKSFAV